MSHPDFFSSDAALSSIKIYDKQEDIDRKQEEIDRERYKKFLGKDYKKYIDGINKHNKKYNKGGGHRRDVCDFFQNIDEDKKYELIEFFQQQHKELYDALFEIPTNEEILTMFEKVTKSDGKRIREITGIYQKDLQYLFLGAEKNEIDKKLISYGIDHYLRNNQEKK